MMTKKEFDTERIRQIIKQLSGKIGKHDKNRKLVPSALIKGKGKIWCWVPTKHKVICVNRGIKVYIIDYTKDIKGRIIVYDGTNIFSIHPDDIEEIGFN